VNLEENRQLIATRKTLKAVAEGLCFSKVRYGLAAYGSPEANKLLDQIQVKLNDVARIITGNCRRDKISTRDLQEAAGVKSVTQMSTAAILSLTWSILDDKNSDIGELLRKTKRLRPTRNEDHGLVDTILPAYCFEYFARKLWNTSGSVRKAKSRNEAKSAIKKLISTV